MFFFFDGPFFFLLLVDRGGCFFWFWVIFCDFFAVGFFGVGGWLCIWCFFGVLYIEWASALMPPTPF